MSFEDIIGQEKTLKNLRNALLRKSLAHAYLFYGVQGVGKYKTGIAIAKALLCGKVEADFCDTCSVCRRIEGGNHPNVYILRPGVTRPGGEWCYDPETGMILIDQIRDMQRWISVRSFEGGHKIAILDGADKMNPQAANALLKTIEEPPAEALLLLISPTKSQLLPTIVSRCQKIYFPPLSKEVLQRILEERGKSEDAEGRSSLLAALADGSVGKAISLDEEWVCNERRYWIEQLIAIETGTIEGVILPLAEEISRSLRIHDILETYCTWYRDLLIFRETGEVGRLLNPDMGDTIVFLSHQRSADDCIKRIRLIERAKKEIDAKVNQRLALENLFLQLHHHVIQ